VPNKADSVVDTLELLVTRPKSFYTVFIPTYIYTRRQRPIHTCVIHFSGSRILQHSLPPRVLSHMQICMLPKEAGVRLQVQMSLTHWIPVITILKDFHGGAFNHTSILYKVYTERTCFLWIFCEPWCGMKCLLGCAGDWSLNGCCIRSPLSGCHLFLIFIIFKITLHDKYRPTYIGLQRINKEPV
jgi:hypothetical protein